MSERVILITGASRGIGSVTAKYLARKGDVIIINYKEQEYQALHTKKNVENKWALAEIYQCDISQEDGVKQMIDYIVKKYGKIDVLINNAGILIKNYLLQTKLSEFDEILGTNFIGAINCTKHSLPFMEKNGYGRIVNISSITTNRAIIGSSIYSMSKAMLNQYTQMTAYENRGKNITINAIISGFIETDMADIYMQYATVISNKERTMLLGKAKSIAEGIAYFVNEEESFVTGQLLTIDGGYSL